MKYGMWLGCSLALFLLISCNRGNATPSMVYPTPVPGKLTIVDPKAPETSSAMANGAVYFVLQNGTDRSVQLQSVTSTVAEAASFHETTENQSIVRMVARPDGFVIPAGESLLLEPGKKHLMLENLYAPLVAGEQFTLTLTFADAPAMSVTVPVTMRGSEGTMDHSQMDHGK